MVSGAGRNDVHFHLYSNTKSNYHLAENVSPLYSSHSLKSEILLKHMHKCIRYLLFRNMHVCVYFMLYILFLVCTLYYNK